MGAVSAPAQTFGEAFSRSKMLRRARMPRGLPRGLPRNPGESTEHAAGMLLEQVQRAFSGAFERRLFPAGGAPRSKNGAVPPKSRNLGQNARSPRPRTPAPAASESDAAKFATLRRKWLASASAERVGPSWRQRGPSGRLFSGRTFFEAQPQRRATMPRRFPRNPGESTEHAAGMLLEQVQRAFSGAFERR